MDDDASEDLLRKYGQLCTQAESLIDVRRWADAQKLTLEAIRLNPTDDYAYCLQAFILIQSDPSPAGLHAALDYAGKGIRNCPEEGMGYRLRAMAFLRLGNVSAAVEAARLAVRFEPDEPLSHFELGNALIAAHAYAEAETVGRHLLGIAPAWANTFSLFGRLALATGHSVGAEAYFRQAISLAPEESSFWNNLAIAVEQQGRKAEAVEFYSRALRLSPENRVIHENTRLGVEKHIDKNDALRIPVAVIFLGIILMLGALETKVLPMPAWIALGVVGFGVFCGGVRLLQARRNQLKAGLNPVAVTVYNEVRETRQKRDRHWLGHTVAVLGLLAAGIIVSVGWMAVTVRWLGVWAIFGTFLLLGATLYAAIRLPVPGPGKKNVDN